MKEKEEKRPACCHLFFGEWQAVRPACLKVLESRFPGLSEKEIIMVHGDEVSESAVLERLKTRDLFVSRKAVVYQEPDFLQPRGRKRELNARLQKALDEGKRDRAARILAAVMRDKRLSLADLESASKEVLGKLALPAGIDNAQVLEIALEFSGKIQELLSEPEESTGERILEWIGKTARGKKAAQVFLAVHLERPDRRNRLLKQFMEMCPVTDLSGKGERYGRRTASLQAQVKAWLSELGKNIEPQALKFFVEKVGEDSLSALKNEAEKLASLSGRRKTITLEDATGLVVSHREEEIFQVTDAIRSRNLHRTLTSFRSLLDQGVHPLAVLSAVRNLLVKILALQTAVMCTGPDLVRERMSYQAFKNSHWKRFKAVFEQYDENPLEGLHPYSAYLNLAALDRFSQGELLDMLEEMMELDFSLKGGKIPPELVMESFFLRNF